MVAKQRSFEMEWAKIHLDRLEAHYSGVISNPDKIYAITIDEDAKRGLLHINGQSIGSIHVIELGLVAGDFIHNLRASLDHIAWDLAGIGNSKRSSEICFPIFGENSPRTQAKITAATLGIPVEAIAHMKSLQPYYRGKAYKSDPLWRLNFLWNANKHRIIGLHTVDSGVLYEVAHGVPIIEERKFEDHTIVTIPLSAKDKIYFNPRPNIGIFFGDEERGVKLTIQDLRDIYEFVSVEVMPPLLAFFP